MLDFAARRRGAGGCSGPTRSPSASRGSTSRGRRSSGGCSRLAAALRAAGLAPGDRIAVLDLNHPSCLELTLACAQIGARQRGGELPARAAGDRLRDQRRAGPAAVRRPRVRRRSSTELRGELPTVERVIRVGGAATTNTRPGSPRTSPIRGHHPAGRTTASCSSTPRAPPASRRARCSPTAACSRTPRNVAADAGHGCGRAGAGGDAAVPRRRDELGAGRPRARRTDPHPAHARSGRRARRCWPRAHHAHLLRARAAGGDDAGAGAETRLPGAAARSCYGASPMPLPVLRACVALFPGTDARRSTA